MTYSEKLKHPFWQKKRLEVMQRDGWRCRKCGAAEKTLNVHHLKYIGANPWDTPDDSLMTLCEDCHDESHSPEKPKTFYMAGKIYHTCWRHSIVRDLRDASLDERSLDSMIMSRAIYGFHHYCGPFFIACDHGCYHGESSHGRKTLGYDCGASHHDNFGEDAAYRNCIQNMKHADTVFAWIDSMDCYGTLFELGIAYKSGIPIYIGIDAKVGSEVRNHMWFALYEATVCVAPNAEEAFRSFFPPF